MNAPLSISINGSANPACFAAIAEIAAIYYPNMMPNATYTDYANGAPAFPFPLVGNVSINPAAFQLSIADGLVAIMCRAGLYGQYHNLGEIIVTQTDEDTFYVGGTCITTGYVPNPALGFIPLQNGRYPLVETDLLKYTYDGERYHEYKRIYEGKNVEFKLSKSEGFNRFTKMEPVLAGLYRRDTAALPEHTYTGN